LPLIAGLAWYVISSPQGDRDRSGSFSTAVIAQAPAPEATAHSATSESPSAEPARVQGQSLTRSIHSDQSVPADANAQSPIAVQPMQSSRVPSFAEGIAALSENVAYGQRKTGLSRTRKASKTGTGATASEILDTSPVAMPLALLDPVASVTTTPEQAAALGQLRSNFADAVGAQKHDPQSREYRDNWVAAQPTADQQYRLWFGDQAYMAQQRAQDLNKQAAQ
jgi:hypothetical protein